MVLLHTGRWDNFKYAKIYSWSLQLMACIYWKNTFGDNTKERKTKRKTFTCGWPWKRCNRVFHASTFFWGSSPGGANDDDNFPSRFSIVIIELSSQPAQIPSWRLLLKAVFELNGAQVFPLSWDACDSTILTGDFNHHYLVCYWWLSFLWCKPKAIKEGRAKGRRKSFLLGEQLFPMRNQT